MTNKITLHQKKLLQQVEKLDNDFRRLMSDMTPSPWFVPNTSKIMTAEQYLQTGLLWLKDAIENPNYVTEDADWRFSAEE